MLAGVIEYGYWKTGIRVQGLIVSATARQKLGSGVTVAVVGWPLDAAGFVGEEVIPASASSMITNICIGGQHPGVRVCLRRLTEEENAQLPETPEGEVSGALRVHPRFEDADLELHGTHTTEWGRCESAPKCLRCQAEIAEGAQAAVWVRYSQIV